MRKLEFALLGVLLAGPAAGRAAAAPADDPSWVGAMKAVHARFTGEKGTLAHFGDSITVTMAYWAPLRGNHRNMSLETEKAFERVRSYMKDECWSQWKGPEFGSQGSMTIRWAHENVEKWLKKLNPEAALIMFGTNDLNSVPLEEYVQKTREVVERCLKNGTVVILSTIPPRSGMLERTRKFAQAAVALGAELAVPVCDYHGECLKRRPEDWDGAAEAFREWKGYEVPTLISRDGVHPSNPKDFSGDYSEEGLKTNGFVLRNYVGLMSYSSVISRVFQVK